MTYRYDFSAGAESAVFETVNPANPAERIGRYGVPDSAEIGRMLERASVAQAEWARVPGLERSRRLDAYIDAVESRAGELAEAGTLEQGKILRESKAETLKCCAEGRFAVGEAARMSVQAVSTGREGVANHILRRPRGIVFGISPWNFPISTPMRKLCPALACGNAVILKPSKFTPAPSCLLAEISKEFFPENLVQVALVDGPTASEIVASGKVHALSFTGSVPTGQKIYERAARSLIPVQLELGGKNAAILNDTEDLEHAIDQIAASAFMTSGQRCTAVSRVLVHERLASATREALVAKAGSLKLGDGMDDATDMGPLCNLPHWTDVRDRTRRAIGEGAVPIAGGEAPDPGEGGYYFPPTILGDVAHESIAGQQEIFGPVLSVQEYATFDEAIEKLNGTEYGLTSALFSNRNDLIQRFLAESQHGMLHVNLGTFPDNNMPFGGVKHSGVGPYSVGPTAINFYTSEHAAYVAA